MESTECLRRLAEQLGADGFETVVQGQARTQLSVRNPAASELTEIIRCDSDNDGKLCFVWSWGAPIAPVVEVRLAAERIAHVLKAVDE
jgi:hypothetical protein